MTISYDMVPRTHELSNKSKNATVKKNGWIGTALVADVTASNVKFEFNPPGHTFCFETTLQHTMGDSDSTAKATDVSEQTKDQQRKPRVIFRPPRT